MGRKKCCFCGRPLEDNEEIVPYKTRSAHKGCYDSYVKLVKTDGAKKVKEEKKEKNNSKLMELSSPRLSEAVSEEEYSDKKELYSYIEEVTGEKLTGKSYGLISKYKANYGFTYKGMLNAMVYFFEALEKQAEGECTGIIPYVYDEAQKYMDKLSEARKYNEQISSRDIEVYYSTQKLKIKEFKFVPKKRDTDVDISSIK